MKLSLGPFPSFDEGEKARLQFTRDMDEHEDFSYVYAGETIELLTPAVALKAMTEFLQGDN